MAATSLQPVVVWWARKDLREFDNPALAEAHGSASRQGAALLVLWVGEARAAGEKGITSGLGRVPWARAALHSRAFVSLALRLWERLGVPAVFAADRASSAVAALARVLAEQDIRIVEAHATALPGPEEAAEETAVQSVLAARGAALTVHDGWLLAPARCLPVSAWSGTGGAGSGVPATTRAPLDAATLAPLARTLPQGADVQGVARAIPDTMTRFRRAVTAHVCLEACLPSPDSPPLPHPGVCPQALQRAVPAMVVAPAALAGGPRPDHAARALALRLARYLTSPLRPCDDTEETLRLDACPPPHHGDGESGSDYEGTPAEQQGVEEEAWDRLCAFLGSDAAPLRRHIASLPRTPLAPSTEAGTLPSPEHAPVDQFHQTRSALATGAGQSGLGAFLSAGVLSPRACAVAALATRPAGLYGELLAAEARAGASGSSGSKRRRRRDPPTMGRDHFVMHLLIRDFFALQMFKYGRAWFGPSAIRRPPQVRRSARRLCSRAAPDPCPYPVLGRRGHGTRSGGSAWSDSAPRSRACPLWTPQLRSWPRQVRSPIATRRHP